MGMDRYAVIDELTFDMTDLQIAHIADDFAKPSGKRHPQDPSQMRQNLLASLLDKWQYHADLGTPYAARNDPLAILKRQRSRVHVLLSLYKIYHASRP